MTECHTFDLWSEWFGRDHVAKEIFRSHECIRTSSSFQNKDHRRTLCENKYSPTVAAVFYLTWPMQKSTKKESQCWSHSFSESRLVWMFWKRKWNCHMVADYIVSELFLTTCAWGDRLCSWEIPNMWLVQLCLTAWSSFTADLRISPGCICTCGCLPVAAFKKLPNVFQSLHQHLNAWAPWTVLIFCW